MPDPPERAASASVSEDVGVVTTSAREGHASVAELLGYDTVFHDRTGYASVMESMVGSDDSTREGYASVTEMIGYDSAFYDRTGYAGVTANVGIPLPEPIEVHKARLGWGTPLRGPYVEYVYSPDAHAPVSEDTGIMPAPADSGRRDGFTTIAEGDVVVPPPSAVYIGSTLLNSRNSTWSPVAGTLPGDLLVAWLVIGTGGGLTAPGWTLLSFMSGVRASAQVLVRLADGSASDSIVTSGETNLNERKSIMTLRGPSQLPVSGDNYAFLQGSNGTDSTFTGPTITAPGKLIVTGCYSERNTVVAGVHQFSATSTTGWTTLLSGSNGNRAAASLHYRMGGTGPDGLAYIAGEARYWRGWVLAV